MLPAAAAHAICSDSSTARSPLVSVRGKAARGTDVFWKQSLLPIAALRLEEEEEEEVAAEVSGHNEDEEEASVGTAAAAAASLHRALGGCTVASKRALARHLPSGGPRALLRTGLVLKEVEKLINGEGADAVEVADTAGAAVAEDEDEEDDDDELGEAQQPGSAAVAAAAASSGGGSGCGQSDASSLQAEQQQRAASLQLAVAALRTLAHEAGESNSQRDCVAWLRSLGQEDGMVDTFAVTRPAARQRFTCWNQYTNQRYSNCGKRIDYILLDAPLAPHIRAGPPLVDDDTEEGALRAATANGRWLPAPTHGALSGLQDANMVTHNTQFLPGPHTGIFYTSPHASDHVAVSVLLDASALGRSLDAPAAAQRTLDARTKACSFRPNVS